MRNTKRTSAQIMTVGVVLLLSQLLHSTAVAVTINVPKDKPTIQEAINTARDGDIVLVAPGTYREYLRIEGKTITLASMFYNTGDKSYIDKTVIDGGPNSKEKDMELIYIGPDVGPDTKIVGLTLQNAEDGLVPNAMLHVLHNRFKNIGSDAIDFENSGGICAYNEFENVGDDAIDLDGACAGVFEYNKIINMGDDGIEIRLHEYSGPPLTVTIRNNIIVGSEEDGIQLIDYPNLSPRTFWIENNLIVNSAMSGIGCMPDGITREDYTAHPLPERVHVINNTIIGNEYGISGGSQFVLLNNIIANNRKIGVFKMTGDSVAAHNLFWQNGTDIKESNMNRDTTLMVDPGLNEKWELKSDSPAVDAGVAVFTWPGGVVARSMDAYNGFAPDLGALESSSK